MTTAQIIDAIVAEGGFDTTTSALSRATILGWVNDRYQEAVAEAGWQKATVELGPTVAGQAVYAIPDGVSDIARLQVNGSRGWKRITGEDIWLLNADMASLLGSPGAFAPAFSSASVQEIELWPAPDTAGYSINALVTQVPALLTDGSGVPVIPVDLHRSLLVDGGIAEGRVKQDERPDLAASYEESFSSGKKRLKKQAGSRVGSGVWQARVGGRS